MVILPVAMTSIPSSGLKVKREATPFHITAESTAFSSLRDKYQCPESALLPPKISPLTRMWLKVVSTQRLISNEISLTLNSFSSFLGVAEGAKSNKFSIFMTCFNFKPSVNGLCGFVKRNMSFFLKVNWSKI